MNKFSQSHTRFSLLLILYVATLLLPLSACGSQPGSTDVNSTPKPTATAPSTPTPDASKLPIQFEFTDKDSGKTATYYVTSRFTIVLNAQQYPKENMQVFCQPAGTIGSISNLPYEAPPLYAVRYEGVQPGTCTIKNGTFLLTVKIVNLPD